MSTKDNWSLEEKDYLNEVEPNDQEIDEEPTQPLPSIEEIINNESASEVEEPVDLECTEEVVEINLDELEWMAANPQIYTDSDLIGHAVNVVNHCMQVSRANQFQPAPVNYVHLEFILKLLQASLVKTQELNQLKITISNRDKALVRSLDGFRKVYKEEATKSSVTADSLEEVIDLASSVLKKLSDR